MPNFVNRKLLILACPACPVAKRTGVLKSIISQMNDITDKLYLVFDYKLRTTVMPVIIFIS